MNSAFTAARSGCPVPPAAGADTAAGAGAAGAGAGPGAGAGLGGGAAAAGAAAGAAARLDNDGPERALAWMTPGAFGGLSIAALSLAAATGGSRRWQAAVAWIAVVALLVAVNATPDNAYHLAHLQQWRQGRLLNFNALAHWLSTLWPLFLVGAMLTQVSARH